MQSVSVGEEETVAVRTFVRHRVADYPAWRAVYDRFDEQRRELGVTNHAVYQTVGDPNDVTVWHDFSTREAAESFASSPQLRETMQQAGVQGQPDVWFTTEA
jgi:hypothetical protein